MLQLTLWVETQYEKDSNISVQVGASNCVFIEELLSFITTTFPSLRFIFTIWQQKMTCQYFWFHITTSRFRSMLVSIKKELQVELEMKM